MKVKELIEQLKAMDPETLVVVSADEEGNAFRPLYEVSQGFFRKDYGEWYGPNDEEGSTGEPAICLWP